MTVNVYGRSDNVATKKDNIAIGRKVYGLAYPLGSETGRGYFSKKAGPSLIRNNLSQLLKTIKGERVMLPDYGTNLYYYLFEPLDKRTFTDIRDDILKAISNYMPEIAVLKLTVLPNEKVNYEGVQGLNITLIVQIKDSKEILDVNVGIG
jgi:phage baseplate assembly protein W